MVTSASPLSLGADADQNLGARSHQREARKVEEIEERRGVHPPQRAVERQRGEGEGAGEALGQHHLEDVACEDVVLGAQGHRLVIVGRDDGGEIGQAVGHRIGGGRRHGLTELAEGRVNPLARAFNGGGRIARFPDRRDREERVGEAIEHQDDRGPHEQHVGQIERAVGRTGQGFDQPNGLVTEIADKARERGRQTVRHRVDAAGRRQRAQFSKRVAGAGGEGRAVGAPVGVDLGRIALGSEHQIGVEPKQAVTPPHFAAFHRFEQEVAAPRHDQPPRGAHGRVAVGNDPPPHQRRAALGQHGCGCGGVFGQACGSAGEGCSHDASPPVAYCSPESRLRTAAMAGSLRVTPSDLRMAAAACARYSSLSAAPSC
jgi:hypothetical protein